VPVTWVHTLVIGSGAAGLNAAVQLASHGIEDLLIVTEGLQKGTSINTGSDKQTYYKLSLCGAEADAPALLAETYYAGGSMHGDLALVEASLSARAFLHLVDLGVPFPRDPYGQFIGYKTDHDPRQRATSIGPYTSREMCRALIREVQRLGIPVREGVTAVHLLTVAEGDSSRAAGAVIANARGALEAICAENVVFAVGGPGGLYRASVYPEVQTGAIGVALLSGAKAQGLPEGYSCWWCSTNRDGVVEVYGSSGAGFDIFRRRAMASEPIRLEYADNRGASQKAYLDSLARQAGAAERLSFASPTGAFRAIASAICRTDLAAHRRLMDRARQYRETFIGWLRGMDIFGSFAWLTPTDPETFLTDDQLVEKRTGGEFKTSQEYEAWAAKQTDWRTRWGVLNKVKLPGDSPEGFPFLDLPGMPRFPDRPGTLLAGLGSSAVGAGLLLVEAVLLFYLGYIAFIRYDVR